MAEETQTPNPDDLIGVGIQAAKAGNKETARVIFQQILDHDKKHERTLLWMASVVETPTERRRYLRAVLKVNPRNKTARKYLEQLEEASSLMDREVVKYGLIAAGAAVLLLVVVIGGLALLSSIGVI
jgi:Tfp pilus assembly protein PilF